MEALQGFDAQIQQLERTLQQLRLSRDAVAQALGFESESEVEIPEAEEVEENVGGAWGFLPFGRRTTTP